MNITELLGFSVKSHASDIHITTGQAPLVRIDGDIRRLKTDPLSAVDINEMIAEIMPDLYCKEYEQKLETEFVFEIANLGRFRASVFTQANGPAAAFRIIPSKIASLDSIGAPKIVHSLVQMQTGLVLVTGPTGSGKSTTLATLIDHINKTRRCHIVTIEDPVEFIHDSDGCLVNQREVGRDTRSFSAALRSALRQDPDVILVGELRDLETIRLTLTAAETGHLVFGTLHASSAAKTIDRIVDVFPAGEKEAIRTILSEALQGVIAQRLLKTPTGGRIAAYETMIVTPAMRNLIREGKIAQIYGLMQAGREHGMITLDQSLAQLVTDNLISIETARELVIDPTILDKAV